MEVHVAQGDITEIPADAIVNPANSLGKMGAGLAGAIRERGGATIESEAISAAPIAVGAALVTSAGDLPSKFVIHAPVIDKPGTKAETENVRRAVPAALLAANANRYTIVAIPGMGTGAGGLPLEDAARAIVEEVRVHKKPFPETVHLVDTSPEMVEAFEEALRIAQQLM